MEVVSPPQEPSTWDISRLSGESAAGQSAWAESYAARALGLALAAQPEFWQHVATVRQDRAQVGAFARRYVRRDVGRRVELLESYLLCAADAQPTSDHRYERLAIANIGLRAWFVDGPAEPHAPQRALRPEAAETIAVGALRIAHRGAGRCLAPDCGELLAVRWEQAKQRTYCRACEHAFDLSAALPNPPASPVARARAEREHAARLHRAAKLQRPRWQHEADRALYDAAIPAVLPDAASRPRARRQRRAGSSSRDTAS